MYNIENVENKFEQPKIQMSKRRARETCAQSGDSLVSYSSIKTNPVAAVYLNQLVDGESAWIEGFAKLSPFLAWHGCFNWTYMKQIVHVDTVIIKNKSLYMCSQSCLDKNRTTMYIGIKNRTYYCFDNQFWERGIHHAAIDDSLCSLLCENNIVDSCGGHFFVSVYSVIESTRMNWARNEPSKRQCVYARGHETRFQLHTASCHTPQAVSVNGYICANSVSSGPILMDNCPEEDKANLFCVFNIPSSRQEAYTSCSGRRGKLADLSSEGDVGSKVKTNSKYWISVYRTFGISEKYIENETVCLAAVRVNDTLYLEPDDCSEEKYYLREQNTMTHSSHYSNVPSNTSPITADTNSNNGPNITLPTTSAIAVTTKTPDNGYVSPLAYIIPSILIVFLVFLVVFMLYRRRKQRIGRNNRKPDDTYTAIYETDNLENGQTVSAVSSIQGQNGSSVRQTQKAKTEELGDKRKKKGEEMQNEDYDKIDFKKPLNVRKDANEETNVYNHVLDTTDNNYDTTKAIKSLQSVGPCENDDTYSHMKDGVAMGDYCGLSVQGRKQGDRGKATGKSYSYSKNVGQKDSHLGTDKLLRFVIVGDDFKDDMKNGDDVGETTQPDEPVTYTKISKVGPKN